MKRYIKFVSAIMLTFLCLSSLVACSGENEIKSDGYSSDEILDKFELFIDECEYDAILGCTELPILYAKCLDRGYKANKKVFDPLQSAIDVLLAEYNQ